MKSNLIIKTFAAILFLVALSQCSLIIPNTSQMAGGYRELTDQAKVEQIDSFIRSEVEEADGYRLRKAEEQIVAGINYRFTYIYGRKKLQVVVYEHLDEERTK